MATDLQSISLLYENLEAVDEAALKIVPEILAFKYHILPYRVDGDVLYVYAQKESELDALMSWIRMKIKVTICSAAELQQGMLLHYKLRRILQAVCKEMLTERIETQPSKVQASPLAELVEAIIACAVLKRASDIHLEPLLEALQIRFRIDGRLQAAFRFPAALKPMVISRLKIMAGLDIAEKRLPQDGRILHTESDGSQYELRLSTLPTQYGEKGVLRILQQHRQFLELSTLGFDDAALAKYRKLLRQPHGLILCCGATGCGKTTTMYASLQELSAEAVNIVTIEDPIERSIDGVVQCGVNLKAGFDFAVGLRAILRQDPDIILVGEIRDEATAQTAVRAAITGHVVLATLHTNDAINAIIRLQDMGVPPFLLADSLSGIIAQRLVRRICDACRSIDGNGDFYGQGCPICGFSGYHGRTALYELLTVNDAVRDCIRHGADRTELYRIAQKNGLITLETSAKNKMAAGITTREEVVRISYE